MLRKEICYRLNEVATYFALIDESKPKSNNIITSEANFLIFDNEDEANTAQRVDYPNSKIVKVRFVNNKEASDNAEFCYLVISKDSQNRLFVYNEEKDYYIPKAVFVPYVKDIYLRDKIDSDESMLISAYIEKE